MANDAKENGGAPPRQQEVQSPGLSYEEGVAVSPPQTSPTVRERELVEVGDASEFPVGSHKIVKVGGRQIGVFNIKGEFYGLPNVCPHQTGPLCEAKILTGTLIQNQDTDWQTEWIYDEEVVICPWHGLEYHVPTGQCMAYPEVRLRRYEVVVDDGKVKVRV
jgi:nitrite reductase/ring-hydroxylating ferredoxin subunit